LVISPAARRENVINRNPAGVGPLSNQMGDPMGEGLLGLSGTRSWDE
jgi:hypothetical protein